MATSRGLLQSFGALRSLAFGVSVLRGRTTHVTVCFARRRLQTCTGVFSGSNEANIMVPQYIPRVGEDVHTKRARLLYQSR